MSKRIMFLLAALLGFALVASACGSDSDDASSSSSDTSAPATTAAASEGGDEAPDLGGRTRCLDANSHHLHGIHWRSLGRIGSQCHQSQPKLLVALCEAQ